MSAWPVAGRALIPLVAALSLAPQYGERQPHKPKGGRASKEVRQRRKAVKAARRRNR